MFGQLEGEYSKLIDEILFELTIDRKGENPLNRKIIYKSFKNKFSFYLALQIVRTKEFRESFLEFYKKFYSVLLERELELLIAHEKIPDNYTPNDFEMKFPKEFIQVEHAKYILDINLLKTIGTAFLNYIWILGINNELVFYTSDHPIVRREHIKNQLMSFRGYCCPGIEIALPLSPNVILILFERNYHEKKIGKHDGKVIQIPNDLVNGYNFLQIVESNQHLFSINNNFEFINEIYKKYPKYFKSDKQRFK